MDEALLGFFTSEDEARAPAVAQALAMMRDWLDTPRPLPYPAVPLATLKRDLAMLPLPLEGIDVGVLLAQLERDVFAHSAQLNHPKYIGHMTQALPWMAVLAEAFIATLNQNQVKVETAYVSTLIENKVLAWLHERVYRRDAAFYAQAMGAVHQPLGNMVNGGTMGNLTALAVALERQVPGVRRDGLVAALRQSGASGLAVVASARVHYSMKKALATLGLGEQALHIVPVDGDNRIDLAALDATIAQLKADNIKIVALVGVAGATETGSIDPLRSLAAIAERERIWFHVDAAWGGGLLMADAGRALFDGIELADSVVIDGHKLFWVAMAQGMVLFRDSASLDRLKHNANYIIRANSSDLGQTSLEGSRRFDALKLWMSFKLLGQRGYTALLGQCAALSAQMQAAVAGHADFELITVSDTFILTYRYAPAALADALKVALRSGDTAPAAALNERLNGLNTALQTAQKEGGHSFVSRTVLESTPYPGPTVVLRVVLTNVRTTPEHLREILAEQATLGAALLAGHAG